MSTFYNIGQNSQGDFWIINEDNETIILNEDIDYQLQYEIRDREDLIDDLIDWISETKTQKEMMKEDLKYLMTLPDKYIFSSTDTNEYIAKSDNEEEFIRIAKDFIYYFKK